MNVFDQLLAAASFVPHGYCLLWQPGLVAMHAASDFLIAAAYFSIPLAIYAFLRRRRDLEFRWVAHLFAVFILLCGTTHLMGAATLWFPYYGLEGLLKLLTAGVSVATAAALWPVIPKALAVPSPHQLRVANERLGREVEQRMRAEHALENRARELERSNRDLEQFAVVASHDLREPLRVIAGYCDLLRRQDEGRLGADAARFLGYAIDGATRMQALIEDLLDYARVGAERRPFAPTDLNVVVAEARRHLASVVEENAAVVEVDDLPVVEGDAAQLTLLFQNLLDNAVKYRSSAPPHVRIGFTRSEAGGVFAVRDNGIGVEAQFAGQIFEVFKRLHTREAYPGTGIGLAICKRIVERHGGRMWLEPSPEGGSCFCFTLDNVRLEEDTDPDG